LLVTNIKALKNKTSGQSMIEFVLIAPILFFIFFGIIQFFYVAYVSFAVQRATFSIAQQAASSSDPASFGPQLQIIEALLPLEQLNPSTLTYALATQCTINTDGTTIDVKVSYPMPIWVPLIRNIIGQNFDSQANSSSLIPTALTNILQAAGLSVLNFTASQNLSKVLWISFEAHALNENSLGTNTN
jgi:Flp pilus assembly protein TadG